MLIKTVSSCFDSFCYAQANKINEIYELSSIYSFISELVQTESQESSSNSSEVSRNNNVKTHCITLTTSDPIMLQSCKIISHCRVRCCTLMQGLTLNTFCAGSVFVRIFVAKGLTKCSTLTISSKTRYQNLKYS